MNFLRQGERNERGFSSMFYKPNKTKKNGNLKFDSTDVFISNLVS